VTRPDAYGTCVLRPGAERSQVQILSPRSDEARFGGGLPRREELAQKLPLGTAWVPDLSGIRFCWGHSEGAMGPALHLASDRLLDAGIALVAPWLQHWEQREGHQSNNRVRIVESDVPVPREQQRDSEPSNHFSDAIYV
jgi:hypothetical protein